MQQLRFLRQEGNYTLCRLYKDDEVPSWIFQSAFYTITKTADELSVVCESRFVPGNIQQSDGWCLLKIDAVLDLSQTGITAKFSKPLADAGINLCVIATYDTDYILIPQERYPDAVIALEDAGFITKN